MNQSLINHDVHDTVMCEPAMHALAIDPAETYVDSTYGRGGHASRILEQLGPSGRLFAFDCDPAAIAVANQRHVDDARFEAVYARFSRLDRELQARQVHFRVAGILADLGVSSPQLDQGERGFSFTNDGPLDMRMNVAEPMAAADWLQTVSERELRDALRKLGGERFAGRIARRIVEHRAVEPIGSTRQLAQLVADCVPTRERDKHPATRTFLAIRMVINRELDELMALLNQSVTLLKQGGRLVVISFHSAEDRLVKSFFRNAAVGAPGPQQIPFRTTEFRPTLKLIGRPRRPDAREVSRNRRARSALMRVAERIGE